MGGNKLNFRKGEKAAKLSVFVLLAVSMLKGTVALISGSIALLADATHSFADIFSSVAVWVGLKLVQKKPTERFPYGYYKAETFALFTVSVIIAASGILILKESVDKLFEPTVIMFPAFALSAAAFSGFVSYLLGRYKRKIGNLINSQSLISEGQHSMVEVYTSILVFIGILLSYYGYLVAEVLVGLLIGVYVIKVGLWFTKDAILILMDACLDPQRVKVIKEIAASINGVKGVHNLRLRKSGPVSFGEMHIELQENISLDKAHAVSEEIETKIKERFKDIESIAIHMGPVLKEKIKIAIPTLEDKGLKSVASLHFGGAPFFVFIEIEKGQINKVYSKENEAAKLTKKKGITVAHFLVNEKVDVVIVGGLGEGPFHVLGDSLVQIYYLPKSMEIEEAVHLLNQNELEKYNQ